MNVGSTVHSIRNSEKSTDFIACVLIFLFSIVGIIFNFFIIYIFYIDHQERTSFNIVCVSRALSNIYILTTTFLSLFFIVILIGYSPYSYEFDTFNIGISINCYIINEYLSCYLTLNRFVAVFSPNSYSKIFGLRVTMTVVILVFSFGIGQYFYAVRQSLEVPAIECYNRFDLNTLAWRETESSRCVTRENTAVVIFFIVLFSCVTVLNVATLAKILLFYHKISEQKNHPSDIVTRLKMRKNIILFAQTILQDLLYLVDVFFTFELSGLSSNRFFTFISKTFVWLLIHSLDGVIMTMFNERLSLFRAHFRTNAS